MAGKQPSVLRAANVFVDGVGKVGIAEDMTLPKLELVTEEFRAGGMDTPIMIDQGVSALESSFTLKEFNAATLAHFGIGNGNSTPFTIRGSFQSAEDGAQYPVVAQMRGMMTAVDFGTWKSGESASKSITISLTYYRLVVNDVEVYEIDIANSIRKINGVYRLADVRKNIGV